MTAWHLYAGLDSSGKISYFRAIGHQASGTIVPVRLGDTIGALRWDARDAPLMKRCFTGHFDEKGGSVNKNLDICHKFLKVSGSIYNKNSPPDRKIAQLELQQWVWDFRSHPSDPEYGKVMDRVIVEIEPVSAAARKEI